MTFDDHRAITRFKQLSTESHKGLRDGILSSKQSMMIHITTKTKPCRYESEWKKINFWYVRCANDATIREDMAKLGEEFRGDREYYLSTFDSLTPVQRADMWRYAVVYMYGGIYADNDVRPKDNMPDFIYSCHASLYVFRENKPNCLVMNFLIALNVETFVRCPQYRQAIFVACHPQHPALLNAVDSIVKNQRSLIRDSNDLNYQHSTLEITGPGVFTDSVKPYIDTNVPEIQNEIDANSDDDYKFPNRVAVFDWYAMLEYFEHESEHSWLVHESGEVADAKVEKEIN